jgi:hypothetical protein
MASVVPGVPGLFRHLVGFIGCSRVPTVPAPPGSLEPEDVGLAVEEPDGLQGLQLLGTKGTGNRPINIELVAGTGRPHRNR